MRPLIVLLGLAGVMGAQTLTEFGAAATGGATGAAAGKKVSDGITAIFGKVDQQTAEAAKADAAKQAKPIAAKPAAAPEAAPAAAPVAAGPPPLSTTNVPSAPKPASKTLRKRAATVDQSAAKSVGKSADKYDAYNLVPPPPPIRRVTIGKPAAAPVRLLTQASTAASAAARPIPVPPPPPVTVEELRRITLGTNREDVIKLGAFASRITVVDEGHLTETFRYAAGVVRVNDGVVAAVELP